MMEFVNGSRMTSHIIMIDNKKFMFETTNQSYMVITIGKWWVPLENGDCHWKTIGKPLENGDDHWKTIGKPLENHRKTVFYRNPNSYGAGWRNHSGSSQPSVTETVDRLLLGENFHPKSDIQGFWRCSFIFPIHYHMYDIYIHIILYIYYIILYYNII